MPRTENMLTGKFQKITTMALVLFCFLMILLPASAQQKPLFTNEIVIERLNATERETQRLKEEVSNLENEQKDLKDSNEELAAELKEYEPLRNWIWVLGIFGIGSVAWLAWLYFKYIPRKVKEQVDAVIAKNLTDRREDFLGLLKEYDFEKVIKQKHQIVLLSHRNGSDEYHHRMLSKNGFQVKAFNKLEQLQQAVFNPDDILVINNDGNHWPADQIQEFINTHPNYCFYFGKGTINPESSCQDRFAAANFKT